MIHEKTRLIPRPMQVLVTVLLVSTISEFIVMYILSVLPFPFHLGDMIEALVDSTLLALLSLPLLWLLIITPLNRAALYELTKSEAQHRAVIEVMPDGLVIMDHTGIIQSINPAFEQIFGYTKDELIGQNISILMPDPRQNTGYNDHYLMTDSSPNLEARDRQNLTGRHKDSRLFFIDVATRQFQIDDCLYFSSVIKDISNEKRIRTQLERLATAVEQADDAIAVTDIKGHFQYINPAFEKMTGYSAREALGQTPAKLLRSGEHSDKFYANLWATISSGQIWTGRIRNRKKDGTVYDEMQTITPIQDGESGQITGYVAIKRDITEQLQLEQQLQQAQKLESIGQLAAGIAHEINTPTQYVSDNTVFLQRAFDNLIEAAQGSEQLLAAARQGTIGPGEIEQFAAVIRKAKLDFLQKQVPPAFEQSLEGLDRVSRIVGAMKEFSHPAQEKTNVDLNRAIQSTITVASNEWKYVAEMHTGFDAALPPVFCLPGAFNQVILNMIVNAAHAVGDVVGDGSNGRGDITVSTRHVNDRAEIRISDTGAGMTADVKTRIFDAFFTTKEVGKGTGQGLAMAHNVIVEKHGGTIDVESEPGKGTTFIIRLPLQPPTAETGEKAA